MDLSKELKFNLYNILVIPLEETIDEISYLYKGKLNEPNVMVIENGDMTPFVCEKLIVKKTQNPEIVILCKNIVNYENPVYLHIPLVYNGFSEPNIIDTLLRTSMKQELEINLNELLENDNVTYGSHKNENHYYFQTPLLIQTKMNQHIIEGMATASHVVDVFDVNANEHNTKQSGNTLKMFSHGETSSAGESIHLLGNQEMICNESADNEEIKKDEDEEKKLNNEKWIYTIFAGAFVLCAVVWYFFNRFFFEKLFFWKVDVEAYDMGIRNRVLCLIVGVILLGVGGVHGSQHKRLDGGNWFVSFLMALAGLFFALGVMPVRVRVDTNNNSLDVRSSSVDSKNSSDKQKITKMRRKKEEEEAIATAADNAEEESSSFSNSLAGNSIPSFPIGVATDNAEEDSTSFSNLMAQNTPPTFI